MAEVIIPKGEPIDMKDTRGLILERLRVLGVKPNENLGQHFLADSGLVDLLAQSVAPGATVIEVGAGVGQLTEALAERASAVTAIEIDRRYQPVLEQVIDIHPNVQVVYGDAIALRFQDLLPKKEKPQIVASLPYHITEPFLHKIAEMPVDSVTLVVGERLARAITARDEESIDFGQLTLLAQTFFDIDILARVGKENFYPVPRTNSAIVRLTPKEDYEFRSSRRDFLLRRLFLTARKSPLVKNALKEGLIEYAQASRIGTLSKREHNQRERSSVKARLKEEVLEFNKSGSYLDLPDRKPDMTQNQARALIEKMALSQALLDRPFEQLNNAELKALSKALRIIK